MKESFCSQGYVCSYAVADTGSRSVSFSSFVILAL